MSQVPRTAGRAGMNFLAVWLWSALAVVLVGALVTEVGILPRVRAAAERNVRHEMRLQLDVRRAAIERWIADARADARTVANFPSARALLTPGSRAMVDPVFPSILTDFAREHEILAIGVFGPGFQLESSTFTHPFAAAEWQVARTTLPSEPDDVVRFVALGHAMPRVAVEAKVAGTSGRVVAVIDPERWLATLLASRALPTAGARIELLQSDADGTLHSMLGESAGAGAQAPSDDIIELTTVPGAAWTMRLTVPRAAALTPTIERLRWWELGVLALLAALVSLGFALSWGQRRAVDAAVQRSRARFSLLLEHANDPILFLDDDGVILRCNQRAEEFYGVPAGSLTGKRFFRDLTVQGEALPEPLTDGVHATTQLAADGRRVAVEVSARRSIEAGRAVTVALVRDVQARIEAERHLLELNRQLRMATAVGAAISRGKDEGALIHELLELAVQAGGMRIVAFAAPGVDGTLEWQERRNADERLAGVPLPLTIVTPAWQTGEAIAETDLAASVIPPADARRLMDAGARGLLAIPVRADMGREGVVLFVPSTAETLQAEVIGILRTTVRDVARAIDAIRERRVRRELEATLEALFTSGPVGIAILRADGRIHEANGEFLRILGTTRERAVGVLNWENFCTCARTEDGQMPCESRVPFEVDFRKSDGSLVGVLVARVRLAGEHERSVAVALDLTAQRVTSESLRQTQQQLLQAQKMETIGRLAGGVAHDFNNLLTVIQGYTQIVQAGGSQTEADASALAQVLRAAERAASLTRQMLAFSRQQVLEPRVLDLGQVLTDTEKMIRRLIGEDIEILMRLPGNLGQVKADPVQVEQVLLNLVVNARDAMPKGGRLTLELTNFEVGPEFSAQHPEVEPGEYVMLAVSDDGEGMEPEILPRIFEPFFTTKESGKGTGLGLATVYGIVRQSGGTLWVRSVRHEGTTFHILLPRVFGEQAYGSESAPQTRGRGETVLVVEDDDMVRPITVAMLERLGYRVLSAPDADSAMSLSRARTGPIDLLLSDVVMRGRNGPELAVDFQRERPGTPVLFVTGYTHEPRTIEQLTAGGVPYLSKPFSLDALGVAVRRALASANAKVGS